MENIEFQKEFQKINSEVIFTDMFMANKILTLLIILLLLSCNDKAKKIEETNLCNQDSNIHYRHNELSILFIGNINKLDNKKIELLHIRNN